MLLVLYTKFLLLHLKYCYGVPCYSQKATTLPASQGYSLQERLFPVQRVHYFIQINILHNHQVDSFYLLNALSYILSIQIKVSLDFATYDDFLAQWYSCLALGYA